jgi:hypothetical protein
MCPDQHRAAIERAVSWSDETYATRQAALLAAARRRQNWASFDEQVGRAVESVLATPGGGSGPSDITDGS